MNKEMNPFNNKNNMYKYIEIVYGDQSIKKKYFFM